MLDAGGVEALVHAAASLQDEDYATRQPAHLKATWWTQVRSSTILAAGVPPQEPSAAVRRTFRHQRHPRAGAGLPDAGGLDQQRRRRGRAAGDLGRGTFQRHVPLT